MLPLAMLRTPAPRQTLSLTQQLGRRGSATGLDAVLRVRLRQMRMGMQMRKMIHQCQA